MQRILTRIDANRAGNCGVCLASHSGILLVLLSPPLTLRAVGREHGRSIPFCDIDDGRSSVRNWADSGHAALTHRSLSATVAVPRERTETVLRALEDCEPTRPRPSSTCVAGPPCRR